MELLQEVSHVDMLGLPLMPLHSKADAAGIAADLDVFKLSHRRQKNSVVVSLKQIVLFAFQHLGGLKGGTLLEWQG